MDGFPNVEKGRKRFHKDNGMDIIIHHQRTWYGKRIVNRPRY